MFNSLIKNTSIILMVSCVLSFSVQAQPESVDDKIKSLQQQIFDLSIDLDDLQSQPRLEKSAIHFGGYGEMHYNNLDNNGDDLVEINFRRFVLFIGYDFSDSIRLESEFEIENTIVSPANRGAVELEQVYIEFDMDEHSSLKAGVILMPIGITNEIHEPDIFYGVNRPIIETTIIPTTWWSGGIAYNHRFDSGLSYDLMLSEGLKTDDPSTSVDADPFDLKAGKQKTSFAAANDLAITARIRYRGIAGVELAAYAQYQPDLDQSAKISYAEDALLIGGHVIYQFNHFKATGLYALWDVKGDAAKAAGKDKQFGLYGELSYRPVPQWGGFVRISEWSQQDGVDKSQVDMGVNYWPQENIVFKFDVQSQNKDAGNVDGFNLALGYQFH